MRRLTEQRVTLRAQLAEQSSTLLGQHPRIKELRAQIGDLEAADAHGSRPAGALARERRQARKRQGRGDQRRPRPAQGQAASSNEQDVQLRALERDAKSQRDLLESYLAKYREATARDSVGAVSPDARIISTAAVSNTPSWPKKLPTVLVAALAMFALSAGFVLTGELLGALPTQAARPMPREPAAAAPHGERPDPAGCCNHPDRTEAVRRSFGHGGGAGRVERDRGRARRRRRAARGGRGAGARARHRRRWRPADHRDRGAAQRRHHHGGDYAGAQP